MNRLSYDDDEEDDYNDDDDEDDPIRYNEEDYKIANMEIDKCNFISLKPEYDNLLADERDEKLLDLLSEEIDDTVPNRVDTSKIAVYFFDQFTPEGLAQFSRPFAENFVKNWVSPNPPDIAEKLKHQFREDVFAEFLESVGYQWGDAAAHHYIGRIFASAVLIAWKQNAGNKATADQMFEHDLGPFSASPYTRFDKPALRQALELRGMIYPYATQIFSLCQRAFFYP
jgi:hypothetical protein